MTDSELRELDAFIAEHVMNMDVSQMTVQNDGIYSLVGPVPGNRHLVKFSPTTERATAMEVLEKCAEKCAEKFTNIEIDFQEGRWSVGKYRGGKVIYAESETLPLAICLFAKKLFA